MVDIFRTFHDHLIIMLIILYHYFYLQKVFYYVCVYKLVLFLILLEMSSTAVQTCMPKVNDPCKLKKNFL